eukprot:PITA_17378
MPTVGIIEPMEESDWLSPMVVQEKKQKNEIRICMDLIKLNDACVHHPFPTPFTDEVLDNVSGQEAYSFTDGFLGYHQIKIAPEDKSKTTFTTKWGFFQYTGMPFGLKNIELTLDAGYLSKIPNCTNLKKCTFLVPFGNLLGHVVCIQGLMVDPAKIVVILNLEALRSVKQLRTTLGHTGYYKKFIKIYA